MSAALIASLCGSGFALVYIVTAPFGFTKRVRLWPKVTAVFACPLACSAYVIAALLGRTHDWIYAGLWLVLTIAAVAMLRRTLRTRALMASDPFAAQVARVLSMLPSDDREARP